MFGALMLAMPASAAERAHGHLKFESTSHDFGQVSRGEVVTRRFTFRNVGDGQLTIQGVHTSCGCTAVEVDKGRKYKPGESGMVEVRFDSTDFSGPVVKTVTILTNQKLSPDRVLTVKAFVKSEMEADPPLADFGSVYSREGANQVVRVRPLGGFKLAIKGLTSNPEAIEAKYTQEDNGDYLVHIQIKPGVTPGFLKEAVILQSNAPHLQEFSIPVRAHVRGSLDYAPNYLEFGVIPKAEMVKRELVISGIEAFEVKKTRLEMIINGKRIDDPSTLSKIASSSGDGIKKNVALELMNQGGHEGSIHGKLFVETSDKDQKEIVVDFYAFFR
jgi:hypothetical protein